MPGFHHETARLILRDWQAGDVARFAAVTNTPAVMRWLGPVMDAERLASFEERILDYAARYGHTFWLVERKEDGGHLAGEVLGFCGLKRINAEGASFPGEVEIGWRLREDAWGHGYAREAASASLDLGFNRFGAEEIFAITIAENTGSWGLMTRLGMRRRGDLDFADPRFSPPLSDIIVYSLTREVWTGNAE